MTAKFSAFLPLAQVFRDFGKRADGVWQSAGMISPPGPGPEWAGRVKIRIRV